MSMTGVELKSFIEEEGLENISFSGIMQIGKKGYMSDGVFSLPKDFKFLTPFSNEVYEATRFGDGYLVRMNAHSTSFSVEKVEKAIEEGTWQLVLVF